jgi:cytochrome c-type biogenesis protein CcmH/NrfG
MNLKRYQEALDAYEQAIRLDPNDADFYNNIMTLLLQTKIDWLVRCKMGQAEKEKQQDTIDLHAS